MGVVGKNIASLKNEGGISVTSTRGKLQILQSHYERLGKVSEGSDFNDDWKEEVEDRVNSCKCASELYEDEVLEKVKDRNEIAQCLRKITNNKISSDGLVG